jgi:pimeloyl-ACP methyl ester carboxylesterase
LRTARAALALFVCLLLCLVSGCAPTIHPPGTLADDHPCTAGDVGADNSRMTCATLTVPLDHGLFSQVRVPGQLALPVAMTGNPTAPRGVLVWLVGGPGSPGAAMAAEIAAQFDPAVLREYRLVVMSGRGTGPTALRCAGLQRQLGDSDLAVPTRRAVQRCADTVGPDRRFYSSASSVEDLELLRRALGARTVSVAGASYGTYLAERYALTHPDHVARLLLDSAVPHDGFDFFTNVEVIRQATTLLRTVCRLDRCAGDPVADLAQLVRQRRDGPALLTLVAETAPARFAELGTTLHDAATGNPGRLDGRLATAARDRRAPADELSQGLHTIAQCQDLPTPWGNGAAALAGRDSAATASVGQIDPARLYPFDADTVRRSGPMSTCEWWPPTPVPPAPRLSVLPPVPTLLLAGDHDLSTPLAWTEHEVALSSPGAQLVIVPGSGHITQDAANPPAGRQAATRFLLAGPPGVSPP